MTGATPVPEHSGGRDQTLTAIPSNGPRPAGPKPEDRVPEARDPEARGDEVEAGIVALWRAYGHDRDTKLRDRLVLHYAPLVKYVAGRVGTGLPAHVDVADLVQSGVFGLVDAIERFEQERGLKFETYAMQRIRGAILDELRAQDWVPRSVRTRAREVERVLERLEGRLQRSASDAEVAVVAFGSPARFVKYAVHECRRRGMKIGWVRPITLWPFPDDVLADVAGRVRGLAVFEQNAGQMIDDVRLAVLGRVPVTPIGGISHDGSGFGVGPALEPASIIAKIAAVYAGREAA